VGSLVVSVATTYLEHSLCSTSCWARDRVHRQAPHSRWELPACGHRRQDNPWHPLCWWWYPVNLKGKQSNDNFFPRNVVGVFRER